MKKKPMLRVGQREVRLGRVLHQTDCRKVWRGCFEQGPCVVKQLYKPQSEGIHERLGNELLMYQHLCSAKVTVRLLHSAENVLVLEAAVEDLFTPLERVVPVHERLLWLVELCEVVQRMHNAGVAHRDLNLQNTVRMADDRIRLIDFGVAARFEPDDIVADRVALGKPMSALPQLLWHEPYNPFHADRYSLGTCILQLLLNGNGREPMAFYTTPSSEAYRELEKHGWSKYAETFCDKHHIRIDLSFCSWCRASSNSCKTS